MLDMAFCVKKLNSCIVTTHPKKKTLEIWNLEELTIFDQIGLLSRIKLDFSLEMDFGFDFYTIE